MSDPRQLAREEQAKRFDAIVEEAAALADHARIAATHFRNAEIARAGAHALALNGHLVNLQGILDEIAVVHASRAQRTCEPLVKLVRGDTLVVASHNPGKVREINDLLAPLGIEAKSAGELGLAEPEETGTTFAANAELKARAAADASGLMALADDSGLAVTALGGEPGIYSARWAGPHKIFSFAIARVENALRKKGTKDMSAKFVCALALAEPIGGCEIFEGEVHGHLVFPGRGTRGFGYDPIFVADGMTRTFGEIDPAVKHGMSHRARAFAKLLEHIGT